MRTVTLRFQGELNDHVPQPEMQRSLFLPTTAKDLIESCGVPHVEVGRTVVNGRDAGFDDPVGPGDEVSVYPHVYPPLPDPPRFVLDVHLGRLAALPADARVRHEIPKLLG